MLTSQEICKVSCICVQLAKYKRSNLVYVLVRRRQTLISNCLNDKSFLSYPIRLGSKCAYTLSVIIPTVFLLRNGYYFNSSISGFSSKKQKYAEDVQRIVFEVVTGRTQSTTIKT